MKALLTHLWSDDAGAVVSTELVLVLGVAVMGLAPGVRALRDADLVGLQRTADSVRAVTPDPDRVRQLLAPPELSQAAVNVQATAVNHNVVVVHVYGPGPQLSPPAP